MTCETHIENDIATISSANRLQPLRPKEEVERLLSTGMRSITIDLQNTRRLDSVTIGELVFCRRAAEQACAHLRVINTPAKAHWLLKILSLEDIVEAE